MTAAVVLFGRYGFSGMLAPPRLASVLDRRAPTIEWTCLAALTITACVWPVLLAAELAGDQPGMSIDAFRSLLSGTGFGHVWLLRLGFVGLLLGISVAGRSSRPRAFAAALVLGSLGLVGHATMPGGALGMWHRGCQVLHLLSAGAWVSSLLPLVTTLDLLGDPLRAQDAVVALKRFSRLGHGLVLLAVATGLADAAIIRGMHLPDFGFLYDRLLGAKIGVVGAMIAIAIVNRYALVPRLRGGEAATIRRLRHLTFGNLALGSIALGLASQLGALDPS